MNKTINLEPNALQEKVIALVFFCFGLLAVLAVVLIALYLIISGVTALGKIGLKHFLLGQEWNPLQNAYGILPFILSSITATGLSIGIALPLGLFIAIYLAYFAGKKTAALMRTMIEVLAGIPSVLYGLLGAILIVPQVFKLQQVWHLPASGSLLAASIVLAVMILPTLISVSEASLRAVPSRYYSASLALGASKMQSIWKVIVPAAKGGIVAAVVLGIGRAIGETMAVMMVAGNAPIMPEFLKPARLLTVAISIEWAYSSGLHREALQAIGFVLFIFTLLINVFINAFLKRRGVEHGK